MNHDIHVLDLGDIELEASFLVAFRNCGQVARVPTNGFLILGNPVGPILVDTGFRSPEIMATLGMKGIVGEDQGLENQLALRGVRLKDIAMVVHTHLHIDHTGKDDVFPMSTPVVINRRELEVAAVGGAVYPLEDIKHILERFNTPKAMRVLDLAYSGPVHIAPGITCELALGHTEGSMNVLVETAEGVACIAGDVVYDVQNQIVDAWRQVGLREPQTTQNYTTPMVQEKAAIKKALEAGAWLLPGHDRPARVQYGEVIGRVDGAAVPGPVTPLDLVTTSVEAVV
jgi:glyoxylase-like metal-dependent hydrolase (beta-lactamase superfamily II)